MTATEITLPVRDVTAEPMADDVDGGIRPCERNLYGFCRTCGADMEAAS